jgi:hypothetical protein
MAVTSLIPANIKTLARAYKEEAVLVASPHSYQADDGPFPGQEFLWFRGKRGKVPVDLA